jgi:uncharacterized membrane protein YgaE (UPF0421/DUF939 family)
MMLNVYKQLFENMKQRVWKMAQEFSNQSQSKNILSLLNEKEQLKLLTLLAEADKHYKQYKEYLKKIVELFEGLQLKYDYLSEENREYLDTYEQISKLIQNLESLIYKVPPPSEIMNKALEE